MSEPKDYPFKEICARAEELAKEGHLVFQKWTCDGCGARLGSENPNVFTKLGNCEHCNVTTDIEKKGCNYMLVMRNVTIEQAARVIEGKLKNDS